MKKAFLLILVSMILLLAFTSCDVINGFLGNEDVENPPVEDNNPPAEDEGNTEDNLPEEDEHEHVWSEATCRSAKTCTICGEKTGGTLPHTLVDATCDTPKTCTVCNQVWGEALGHNMSMSTCTTPSTCRRCGLTEGEAPGHDWAEANCLYPKTCNNCKTTEGTYLGHNYVEVVTEATCETGGSTVHTCERCNDTYVDGVVEALGHLNDVVLEAKAPTCTENGLTAGVGCSRCGTATTKQRPVAATGHKPTETVVEPTCTSKGYTAYHCTVCEADYTGKEVPALGHSYGTASCTDAAVCSVCGFDNGGEAIGHDWAEATCSDPKKCLREGCGVIEGEPLGHEMLPGSCLAPATCSRCGHTEGEKDTHVITSKYEGGVKTYLCTLCGSSYKLDNAYVLDGSGFDGMTGVNNTLNGYTTAEDKPQYPLITDEGYYQLLQLEDTGAAKQLQIWVPRDNTTADNFTSGNGAVGFYSFKINAYMDTNFGMQFVDGSSGGSRWSADWCIADKPFNLTPPTADAEGRMMVTATGWDNLVLFEKDVTDSEDKFTGWFEVVMGIVLDPETDTITVYYYVDGKYVGFAARELTTLTNGINCVYISGNTQAQGSGIFLDDITFGYTVAGSWVFDTHMHTWTAGSTTAPTCTADGYTTYTCACGAECRLDLVTAPGHKHDIPVEGFAPTCTEEGLTDGIKCSVCGQMTKEQKVIKALGHTEVTVPSVLPTCTEGGHGEGKMCSVCGEPTTDVELLPALGHNYVGEGTAATCTDEGHMTYTCSACGEAYEETLAPLGHNYGDAKCTDSAICSVCGVASEGAIGHNFAPATCTEPAICTRGCGTTTGEPLGHNMAPATCLAPSTCEACGLTEGEKALHTLEHKYSKGVLTYFCAVCDNSYAIETGYYLDGSNHDDWVGRGNATNYTVSSGHLPAVVDGHYELLNKNGKRGQIQLWIPEESKTQIGFSGANNALGYLSFKLNAYISSDSLDFKLVDSISNQGDNRWKEGGVAATALLIKPVSNGYTQLVADDGTVVANIAVGEDNFTGWVDVKIAIELRGEFDQMTLHYYINGKHVHSMTKTLTTITNSINSVYISGYSTAAGSGIKLDDVAFGFTPNGEFVFDTCKHEFVEPTCSTNRYCSVCGYVESGAIGHHGGEATCDTLAVCDDCGQSYGDYAHKMSEATCYQLSVCSECGKSVGSLKAHNLVLSTEAGKMKYSCSMCGAYYYVDTYYYLDGSDYKNMTPGGFIAQSYANNDGYPVIAEKDGNKYYELINISGVNDSNNSNKAEVWLPAGHPNAEAGYFTGFSAENNATGFLSFKVDAKMDLPAQTFKIQLLDHNARNLASNFWVEGALPEVFTLNTPVDDGNGGQTVTLVGWNKRTLETIQVNADGFTGWIDVKIALVMNSNNTITAHYYINGEYKASETIDNRIITGEITAAYFFGYTYGLGCGFRLDDMVLGYTAGGEMVPGITPDTPVEPEEPDTPEEPEDLDKTFDFTFVDKSNIKNMNLKTIVLNKIKQWDQSDAHNVHTGTPKYVVAKHADGTTSEGLYFSRTTPWLGDEGEQFSEFRFAVNSEQPGAYVTKITFNYIIKGTVETNSRYEFTDLEGNKFYSDAYVQVKTNGNHPMAGDNYPELSGTDLKLDGAWHTMTIDFGPDGLEILDILLNLYHFQGEFIIADLNIEYRN